VVKNISYNTAISCSKIYKSKKKLKRMVEIDAELGAESDIKDQKLDD
jgi:hypothetical protein